MRTGVRPIFIILLLVALFAPLYLIDSERHSSLAIPWKNSDSPSDASSRFTDVKNGNAHSNLTNKPPKITIIVIWVTRSDQDPHYMAWFWQGVQNNPKVNLLFVNVDIAGNGCKRYSTLKNVKVSPMLI